MTSKRLLNDSVLKRCLDDPLWASSTAYKRTLIVCRNHVSLALPIPSWHALRTDFVGKGSGTDIQQAKNDFLAEHAQQVAALEAAPQGVPPSLAPLFSDLWQVAVQEALLQVDAKVQESALAVAQACSAADAALVRQQAAEQALAVEQASLVAVREALDAARSSLQAEREARHVIEASYAEARADLQRTQGEVDSAITRLEGVENHALMRIADVEQRASAKLLAEQQKTQREVQELRIESAKWRKRASDIERQHRDLVGAHDILLERLEGALARCQRAERQLDSALQAPSKPLTRGLVRRQKR